MTNGLKKEDSAALKGLADLSPLLPSCRQNRKISGGSVRADNRTACCYCGML